MPIIPSASLSLSSSAVPSPSSSHLQWVSLALVTKLLSYLCVVSQGWWAHCHSETSKEDLTSGWWAMGAGSYTSLSF